MIRLPLSELPALIEELHAYPEQGERRSAITRDAVLFALLIWVRTKALRFAANSAFEGLGGQLPAWRRISATGVAGSPCLMANALCA